MQCLAPEDARLERENIVVPPCNECWNQSIHNNNEDEQQYTTNEDGTTTTKQQLMRSNNQYANDENYDWRVFRYIGANGAA